MALAEQKIIERVEVLEAEAISFIRKYEPLRGYFLAFSGGKDSIVIEKLCRLAGVKYIAGYSRTGIDPPEVMKFIKTNYPDVEWLKPKEDFYTSIRKKMPPLIYTRWCCDLLKERAGLKFKKYYPIHIIGVRAEESAKRALRPRIDIQENIKTVDIKPIFNWLEYHIWAFIEKYNLEYPCLYDEGFDRIGCVCCPYLFTKDGTKLKKHMERWPKIYKAFESAVRDWWENKQNNQHDYFHDYFHDYLHGFCEPQKPKKEIQGELF